MKTLIYKMLLFFRELFLNLHVALALHIGLGGDKKRNVKSGENEDSSQKGD